MTTTIHNGTLQIKNGKDILILLALQIILNCQKERKKTCISPSFMNMMNNVFKGTIVNRTKHSFFGGPREIWSTCRLQPFQRTELLIFLIFGIIKYLIFRVNILIFIRYPAWKSYLGVSQGLRRALKGKD